MDDKKKITLLIIFLFFGFVLLYSEDKKIIDSDEVLEDSDSTTKFLSNDSQSNTNETEIKSSTSANEYDKKDIELFFGKAEITPNFFNYFEKTNGKCIGKFFKKKDALDRIILYLYDGIYNDDKKIVIDLKVNPGTLQTPNYTTEAYKITNATFSPNFTAYVYDEWNNKVVVYGQEKICNDTMVQANVEYDYEDDNQIIDIKLNSTLCSENFVVSLSSQKADEQNKIINYSIFVTLITAVSFVSVVKLLKLVAEEESEGTKFSIFSICFVSIWDGALCMMHFYYAIESQKLFQYFITPSFCYLSLFTIFETRLLILVWKATYYPGPINVEELRKKLFRFYMKFYLMMFICFYLLYNYIYSKHFEVLINLYLVPQIIHQAIKGSHTKINVFFVFGLMVIRSFLPLYIRGCPSNIYELSPSIATSFFIILVVVAQIAILYCQELLGARFFVPKMFLPNQHEYFRTLPQEVDLESGAGTEYADECIICMNGLHSEPSIQPQGFNKNQDTPFMRRIFNKSKNKIMVSPCSHKFHAPCLLEWMAIKLECPTCRQKLPPL